jgi:hypothetical protein
MNGEPEALRRRRDEARRVIAALTAALTTIVVGRAEGDSGDAAPLRVVYDAPEGCPDHEAFIAQVLARSDRIVSAVEGQDAREFRVAIRRHADGFEGDVQSTLGSAETSRRSVPGTSCASVAEALALIVALSLDPQASTGPLVAPASVAQATGPAPATPGEPAERSPADATAKPASDNPTADTGTRSGALDAAPPLAWFVLLDAALAAGVAPDPLLSPGLAAELDGGRWLLRMTLHGALSGSLEQPVGAARFVWLAARVDGCAPRVGDVFQLWPCASLEGGTLFASGSGTDDDRDATDAWLAPGLNGRLRWLPAPPWVVEAQVGASFPLIRQRYLLPEAEVYRVPWVAGWAGVAAGLRLK